IRRTDYPNGGAVTSTWEYDLRWSIVIEHVDGTGRRTTYTPDDRGNIISTTITAPTGTPASVTLFSSYDSRGLLTSTTDRNGNTPSCEYDDLGRLIRTTFEDGSTQSYSYDDNSGNPVTYTDEVGVVTTTTYDPMNRVLTKTVNGPDEESGPWTWRYGYDK